MNHLRIGVVWNLLIAVMIAGSCWGGDKPKNDAHKAVLSVGKATRSGTIRVEIEVWKYNGKPPNDRKIIPVVASIPEGTEAKDKAKAIFDVVSQNTYKELLFEHTEGTNVVTAIGKKYNDNYSWKINSISTRGNTNERDGFDLYDKKGNVIETGTATVSVKGAATGADKKGDPGHADASFHGKIATVYTFPGMTAQQVEQELISQFVAQGVPARWVTPEDRIADDYPNLVGDGIAIILEGVDANGFSIDIKDTGLALDVGAVFDGGEFPSYYDNGPLITHPEGGFGGADLSALQVGLGLETLGRDHKWPLNYSIADDFEVSDPYGWRIHDFTAWAYQTDAGPNSTIVGMYMQIWDGAPDDPGSNVVWGDLTTNILDTTEFDNLYRASEATPDDSAHAVYRSTGNVDTVLSQGTYWIEWSMEGSANFTGPWAPPNSILGETTTGNAKQNLAGNWVDVEDAGTLTPQGFPFLLRYTVASPDDCLTLAVDPLVAGFMANWIVSGATPGTRVAIVYGLQPGETVVDNFGGYCATFGIKGVRQNSVLCQKTVDGNGQISCQATIPLNLIGRRVLSQAAVQGTCPDECVSNLDDQVIQ